MITVSDCDFRDNLHHTDTNVSAKAIVCSEMARQYFQDCEVC